MSLHLVKSATEDLGDIIKVGEGDSANSTFEYIKKNYKEVKGERFFFGWVNPFFDDAPNILYHLAINNEVYVLNGALTDQYFIEKLKVIIQRHWPENLI